MEATDGSVGFEFGGVYTLVEHEKQLSYTMTDNPSQITEKDRKAEVHFETISENETKVTVFFEPENENPRDMQQGGWQSILDNFKKYVERTSDHSIIINASVEKVWKAFTTKEQFESYMNGMTVVSDWKAGSPIVYTCYNKDGSVMLWNEMEMVWNGVIQELVPNEKIVTEYNGSAGIEKETYVLEKLDEQTTKLTFIQTAVDPKRARNYEDGNTQTLELLKQYCEKSV
jgi:uncharacterized protein YndB with AHSA1/START domain